MELTVVLGCHQTMELLRWMEALKEILQDVFSGIMLLNMKSCMFYV